MITNNGKTTIKRFMAGQVSRIAGHFVLGVGDAPESLNDTTLEYEVVRVPIETYAADLNTDRLIFKATVLPGSIGMIREAGLVLNQEELEVGQNLGVLSTSYPWTNAVQSTDNVSVTTSSLQVDFSASGTSNAELSDIALTLRPSSSLQFAYFATDNLSSIRFRLGSDSSNYFEFADVTPVEGHNVYSVNLSDAAVVGSPSWDNISYLAIRPSGTTEGDGSVFINGIRESYGVLGSADLLVARRVLVTPVVVDPDLPTTIEYPLVINV